MLDRDIGNIVMLLVGKTTERLLNKFDFICMELFLSVLWFFPIEIINNFSNIDSLLSV